MPNAWTTNDEIDFAKELAGTNRDAFLKYAGGIGGRTMWGNLDGEKIKSYVQILLNTLPNIREAAR